MTVWANGTKSMPSISSPYGYSDGYTGFHGGTDFYGFTTNCAHDDGTVIFAGWTNFGDLGGGIEVAIQHDGYVSRILHNRRLLVSIGDTVTAGQAVGIVGGSGYGRQNYYNDHCHDEVRLGGRYGSTTDPLPFFQTRIGSSVAGSSSKPIPPEQNYAASGDSMLVMNQGPANTLALYDDNHWQEFYYGDEAPTWMKEICGAWNTSLPVVPYSPAAWDLRSNKCPSLKNPIYRVDLAAGIFTKLKEN